MGPSLLPVANSLTKLLSSILNSFISLCHCDAGAVYTVRKRADGSSVLVFDSIITQSKKLYQVPDNLVGIEFEMDDTSLVGSTARRREFLHSNAEHHNLITNYHVKNILSAPLITPRGDLVGVVQLLNKLPYQTGTVTPIVPIVSGPVAPIPAEPVIPVFDARDERLLSIVAGQAALAIENSLLLEEQEKLLEGFVNACVTAIEARDPITSGHSSRVADYSIELAQAMNRETSGPFKELKFAEHQIREIRFAAMLHDIGKISVKEEVLNKEKKLFPYQLEMISMRLKLMRSELRLVETKTGISQKDRIAQLHDAWRQIAETNEPTVLPKLVRNWFEDLENLKVKTEEGDWFAALTGEERIRLQIAKGSLTPEERFEVERHVSHTYEILRMVPWSKGLEKVPEIAHKHHEKLDGSGYPCKLHSDEIPLQSRILTICDIYDALTADDRPYKHSVPFERALGILESEVISGKLDRLVYQVFLDAKVYELGRPSRIRRVA